MLNKFVWRVTALCVLSAAPVYLSAMTAPESGKDICVTGPDGRGGSTVIVCDTAEHRLTEVGPGYCRTSVNGAVFRGSSVVSHGGWQYTAYYDRDGYVTVARRRHGSDEWETKRSVYKGNVADGHNVISIGVDGDGYLHVAFDHHGSPLHYCRATAPGSIELGPMEPMTGENESDVTYPEFYTMPDGDMLFAYRSGASGCGNLVLNRYDSASRRWQRVQDVLIDGEGKRNAYWQMYVDSAGVIYLSWVWRETWLVETNHDLCFACSHDGGHTWERSDGSAYSLPITEKNAEIAWSIPQNSNLINQTGMTADGSGHPYIATYWSDGADSVPQYRLVWHNGSKWQMSEVGRRTMPFSLAGGGTKMIPMSRPRIASDGKAAYYLFRDQERGSRVSVAYTPALGSEDWKISDVTDFQVGAWEPTYDTELWNRSRKLHIFVQKMYQGDGERVATDAPESTPVYVLEYNTNPERDIAEP